MPKVDRLYAFLAQEGEDEGLVAAQTSASGWMPLVGADMDRVDSVRELAKQVARTTDVPITLALFSVREDLEVIEP